MANNESPVVAVFDDRYQADLAVHDLEEAGFDHDHVGLVIRGSDATQGGMITDAVATKDARGAAIGAVTGAVAGGILGALAWVLLPGVGPVLAGGFFAGLAGGAGAGTAIGGILGAMTGLGISEDEARYYEERFHEGKAIVAVRAGNRVAEAEGILLRHGGYNMHICGTPAIPTSGVMNTP
ncbi:MAG TPA: hypothetical protein VHD56_08980 [Tepidisphaeraceae bacterium]|nr:hypothetical protein [Tepidisphaeraceae bacterium]